MRLLSHAVVYACAVLVAACSPTYNWRELPMPGGQAVASFPCKPSRETRRVSLAGTAVEMTVLACSTDGVMFAIGTADVADPALVGPALAALQQAAVANVAGRAEPVPFSMAGATPHPQAGAWRVAGRMPDGRAVQEQVAVFSKGTRAYQLTMIAPALPPEPLQTFMSGIRWP